MKSKDSQHEHPPDDGRCTAEVEEWAKKIPIGLGLCPWAGRSHNNGLLRIVTCGCDSAAGATAAIEREIDSLTKEGTLPLSTTLVVCPRVKAWEDFGSFDEFVRTGIERNVKDATILDDVTLVAFHPNFLRWRGLPTGVGVGSEVRSHWGTIGRKSPHAAEATVVETDNKAFGMRKIKVRFRDAPEGLKRREQYVPTDWIDVPEGGRGPPLPDNAMHRAPHPAIHVITNGDLASLRVRDVSRVKRLNARSMAKLGWEGLERLTGGGRPCADQKG